MSKKNKALDHIHYEHWIDPNDVIPYDRNAKQHTEKQVKNICNSIKRFGWQQDTVITKDNVLIIGHGRRLAAIKLGCEMPYHVFDKNAADVTEEDIRELRIADNQTNAETGFDFDMLSEDIEGLDFDGFDFDFDYQTIDTVEDDHDEGNDKGNDKAVHPKLSDRFVVPPFTVLDARQGYWQDRKAAWRELIGDTGQARDGAEAYTSSLITDKYGISSNNTTSILDPVLSEIVCRWFLPHDGCKVFDCFAGDTVFGYVSARLGHDFTGIELRQEQVDFNNNAVQGMTAKYICDDGRNVGNRLKSGEWDLFFSCPPYFDLEQYSDLPNDASNQETYQDFYQIIDDAFTGAVKCLKNDRFAVVVCGDIRNKSNGAYYDFPSDIKRTFRRNGMTLYNEMVLVDPIGTATIRAANNMRARKMVKVHQNVLVFYKGDTRKISKIYPLIEVDYEGADMEL